MTRNDSIRQEIIFHLYAIRPAAHLASTIHREALKNGLRFEIGEIKAELQFLADRGLIKEVPAPMGTESLYRITDEGVKAYEQNA